MSYGEQAGTSWRRGPLRWLAVVIALACGLAGCGGSGGGTGTQAKASAGGSASRRSTLILGQFRPPTGDIANPYVAASDALVSDGLHELVYEPLFYINYQTGKSEPWLATGDTYSNGNRTITISLRKSVTWNDGTPFSSADVVFTIEQIVKAKAPYRAASIQSEVKSVSAQGPDQVTITLKAPDPRFVDDQLSSNVYTSNFIPMPAHIFQGKNFNTYSFFDLAKGLPVGTGPYKLASVGPSSATLVRNDNWWAAKTGFATLPAPKRVIYTLPGPEDTVVNSLETNQLDYAGEEVPTVAGYVSARQQNPKLINWNGELGWDDPCPWSLTVNTSAAPWNNPQMRWALNYAINKSQFSEVFNSPGPPTPARSWFPEYPELTPLLNANQDLFNQYPTDLYSLAKSASILQSLGYHKQGGTWVSSAGKPLALRLAVFSPSDLGPAWSNAAQLLSQELSQAGIKPELQVTDLNSIITSRSNGMGSFDAETWFECGSSTDPWATLNRYTNSPGADNPSKWTNPQYNTLVNKIAALPPGDPQIKPLFRQALTILLAQLPVIPLAQRPDPIVMNQTYWTGWPTAQNGYTQPAPWGMNFHQVITHLRAAGGSG
jgi:peptide/nickel transport system substrate-binding protein